MSATPLPLVADLGAPELLIILVVLVLLFGAKKLPDLARGTGQALRIFKAETKGLMDEDDAKPAPATTEAVAPAAPIAPVAPVVPDAPSPIATQADLARRQAELDAERRQLDDTSA